MPSFAAGNGSRPCNRGQASEKAGPRVPGPPKSVWEVAASTKTPGERVVSFPTSAGSVYEVVAYNYVDGFTVNYAITE